MRDPRRALKPTERKRPTATLPPAGWTAALLAVLPFLAGGSVSGQAAVRAWEAPFSIPVYEEGPPNPNPAFDIFDPPRITYPYTIRDNLTDNRVDRSLLGLFLENEYLKCVVLPEIGGHLYSCTDKRNGEEVFYANPSIKLTKIGYRGAWAAFGVEFNFPVSHNWMSTSPVDYAYQENEDGSGSIWVGNIDRVFGTHWLVELKLRPGRAVLEQHTTLYNRSDFRHRFYWWTNAAVQVWDDSRVLYPQTHTASHGFQDIDTWPVDFRGTDNSVVGNHVYGPVSRFSHGSREPYMAVYHPRTKAGVVHYSSPVDLPAKKVWSFGGDDRGLDWREALSDNGSAYVEIQAGVFRNQETYGFLEPQQKLSFSEHWLPILELGGVSRATTEAVVHMERRGGEFAVAINVAEPRPGARVQLHQGATVRYDQVADLTPSDVSSVVVPVGDSNEPFTLTLVGAQEEVLVRHTEGVYDLEEDMEVGPVEAYTFPEPEARSEGEWLSVADDQERNGLRVAAATTYAEALERHPGSLPITRAAGRLTMALKQSGLARRHLSFATDRVSNDLESWYHLGHAHLAWADTAAARSAWEKSQAVGIHRTASLFNLAALAAATGDRAGGVRHLEEANGEAPRVRALVMQSALERVSGQQDRANQTLERAQALDPTNSHARYERTLQGQEDPGLWVHLAGDPERIIEVAVDYSRFGLWEDALAITSRTYPTGEQVVAEPGQPHPTDYPLLHYYRAFYESRLGLDPSVALRSARDAPLDYVFPNRHESLYVLTHALDVDEEDWSARFLRGAVFLSGGMADEAMDDWLKVQAAEADIRLLPYLMAMTFKAVVKEPSIVVDFFEVGLESDPENEGIYFELDELMGELDEPASERADMLLRFPDPARMTPDLVYLAARRLAEAGRFDEAESLFRGRFFAREEGGTNPREVWLEARLRRADHAATSGRCDVASSVVDGLLEPVDDMTFTESGLSEWLARRTDLTELRDQILIRCAA